MWEEHMYHYKSDWSQRKLKKALASRAQRNATEARIQRNIFLSAEEAHVLDPTYVVRAAVHALMLGGVNSDKDMSFGRCLTFADRNVPKDIMENISGK